MNIASLFIAAGAVAFLALASGVWLTHSGKPLNTALFTVHKLIALAAVAVTAMPVYQLSRNVEMPPLPVVLIVAAGVGVVALFATGALMSLGKPAYGLLLTIHRVAPFAVIVAVGLSVFLLAGRT